MVAPRTTRHVVHLMHGDVLLQPNLPLPALDRGELAGLSQFVRDAWSATTDWHRLPGDELVLRALPMYGILGDICFEIESPRHPGVVRRFLYERVRGILVVQGSHFPESDSDSDRSGHVELFVDSALRIIAAREQGPAPPDFRPRVEVPESFAPNPAPGCAGIFDLAHRFVDHWFAPRARGWTWRKRFLFTLAGSITFFLFWTGYVVGSTAGLHSFEFNLVTVTFLGLSVVGSPWFAGITAWKDQSYGPVRLFLSGFLLPYLVWTLVAIMYDRPVPDFVGTRESASDARPAPGPTIPAPSDLEPRFSPPQQPELQPERLQ